MTKYYNKPSRVRLGKMAEANSTELVTPCRLFMVFIVSTVMVLVMSFSVYVKDDLHGDTEFSSEIVNFTSKPYRTTEGILMKLGRDKELTVPYRFDFKEAMRIREESLERYQRPSHKWMVERRSGMEIEEFWDIYDSKWPVIVTDIVQSWTAMNWTKAYLLKNYGKQRIMFKSVRNGKQYATGHFLELDQFADTLHDSDPENWNYMEDELFLLYNPTLKADIGHNRFSGENFFDLFPYEIRPWDSCFYWGARYSRSTLHMDPYNWTGTSAVIRGRKIWKLFPPGQDKHLYIEHGNVCGFPLECHKYNSPVDAFNPDLRSYPHFSRAQYLETELHPGEMLIIPTGWYHQAYNTEETISVSGQIMNRNNYLVVLEEIIKAKNIKRRKLPPHFETLLPPDQVKLFLSLLPKRILKRGKEINAEILSHVKQHNDEIEKLQDIVS